MSILKRFLPKKKIKVGDIVYIKIPINQFGAFNLFKVTEIDENDESATIKSTKGVILDNVNLSNLKRSDLLNDN